MDLSKVLQQSQQLAGEISDERVRFLQDELAVASTFLDVAKTTHDPQTRERNIGNARKARDVVVRGLEEMESSEPQRASIQRALADLEARLSAETYL